MHRHKGGRRLAQSALRDSTTKRERGLSPHDSMSIGISIVSGGLGSTAVNLTRLTVSLMSGGDLTGVPCISGALSGQCERPFGVLRYPISRAHWARPAHRVRYYYPPF